MSEKSDKRGEGTLSPEAAVREVCGDWHELSEHQRDRSRELFEAGRRFEREAQKAQEGVRK